ncbi:short chain dehydrogenase/reductase [Desulfosarcina variabilis str. Montpellier]|uniref:SDR family oxidoreductase n=1 Tax=Desulfosarcina variabilis TaxID=2300 RepID=UPI003AFA5937
MTKDWVLILGANSDMARATARRFASAGYNIQLASRNIEELKKESEHIRVKYRVEVQEFFFDALNFDSHADFYTELKEKPSGVVVAFGILGDEKNARRDFPAAKTIIDTNYTGAVSILEIIAADFERRRWGFIVGISSVAGDRGRQSNYLYGSAKAGFSAYLGGLRHRLFAAGVSVLTVKPGFVHTKMTRDLDLPEKLTATPEEVAEKIFSGVEKKKSTVYVKPVWMLIMSIIIHLPEWIFKRTKL